VTSLMSSSQILDKHTIFDMFFNVTLQWRHWCHLPKSLINILSLICFAQRGHLLSYLTSQTSPSMQDCSEKSILSKPINDSIYLFFLILEKHLFLLEPIVLVMSCYCLWYSWVNQFTNSNWWNCNWNCCFL
jgi:hypothetical protein